MAVAGDANWKSLDHWYLDKGGTSSSGSLQGNVWSGINTVPVMILNMDIIWQSLYSLKLGLVLGFSTLGIGLSNGEGVLSWVDKHKFMVLDSGFPDGSVEQIGVFLAISVNELISDRSCCEESNFVKFHLNLGLRQEKLG